MEHSAKFEKVKYYYDNGLWSKAKVKNAVVKGWITEAEYEEITGEHFEAAPTDEDLAARIQRNVTAWLAQHRQG